MLPPFQVKKASATEKSTGIKVKQKKPKKLGARKEYAIHVLRLVNLPGLRLAAGLAVMLLTPNGMFVLLRLAAQKNTS
jgi:hypothetical protein